jgi:hypothetical protein
MRIIADRILMIISPLLAALAVWEIYSTRLTIGIVLALGVLVSLGVFIYDRYQQKQSLFTHLAVAKSLSFPNPSPDLALFSTTLKSRANYNGITEMWFRNISADGQVTNIQIDDEAPNKLQRKAGSWEVCKEFGRPIQRSEIVTIRLSYGLQNSFPADREGITHVTATRTQELTMHVQFHRSKVPHRVRAFVEYSGVVEEVLEPPLLTRENTHLDLRVRRPKIGGYYTLEWDW